MIDFDLFEFALLAQAAAAPAGGAAGAPPPPLPLIPIAIMCVLFYVVIIRPQMKKQKDAKLLASSLKTGDMVVTIGGIHGMVTNIQETTVTVKVADNVKIKFQRTAIDQVVKTSADPAPEPAPVSIEKA